MFSLKAELFKKKKLECAVKVICDTIYAQFVGVGRLIYECRPTPRVFPIYHEGMEHVKPVKKFLRVNKKVTKVLQQLIV